MRDMCNRCISILVLLGLLCLAHLPGASAQTLDPLNAWLAQINQTRLNEGLAPYGFSQRLTAAAQRHAADVAAHQLESHAGSDDSTPEQRIADAGYLGWRDEEGALAVGEIVWAGSGAVEDAIGDAIAAFLADPAQRERLLSDVYREVGIGLATGDDGRAYYVLDFGVRPNVLPVFINDDAVSTANPQVAIRLTNERFRPEGEGNVFIGRAIEIQVSNAPNFSEATWRPWEPLIPWNLPNAPGEHTVYIQFRDAAGRTAASTDAIILGEGTFVPPTLAAPDLPPQSPATTAAQAGDLFDATPTFAPLPTAMPLPAAPGGALSTSEATPFPTWTPLPTVTSTPSPATTTTTEDEIAYPLGLLITLQGVALLLGGYLAFRRGSR